MKIRGIIGNQRKFFLRIGEKRCRFLKLFHPQRGHTANKQPVRLISGFQGRGIGPSVILLTVLCRRPGQLVIGQGGTRRSRKYYNSDQHLQSRSELM